MSKTKSGITISLTVNGVDYEIKHDGFSFIVKKVVSDKTILKYPTTLNRAFELILNEESLKTDDNEIIPIKEFVDRYESLVNEVRQFDTKALDREMRDNPVKLTRGPKTEESIAKMKATINSKKELEHNIPTEEDDDDGL